MSELDHGQGAMAHAVGAGAANVNYAYFLDYVARAAAGRRGLRVLDFGCGMGEMVALIRGAGFECSGTDVFYEGASWEDPDLRRQPDAGHVREIRDGRIPFDDDSFDLVISNQVFEHVEDIEDVYAEVNRVLRSDGVQYHHFPSREVIREGHIGIPLAHRMRRGGRLRHNYTLTLRRLGFGTHKDENPDPERWTAFKLDWIDNYCFYRPYADLVEIFGRDYEIVHREIDYCRYRAAGRPVLARLLATKLLEGAAEAALRRLAFMAIELRRRPG